MFPTEYLLGNGVSVKVTRMQTSCKTVDNSENHSILTTNPSIYGKRDQFAGHTINSRFPSSMIPPGLQRGQNIYMNASSLTTDLGNLKGSTPQLGMAGITSPKSRNVVASVSPVATSHLKPTRVGLSLHRRHISSETELHSINQHHAKIQKVTNAGHKNKAEVLLQRSNSGNIRYSGLGRRQTLSDVPKIIPSEVSTPKQLIKVMRGPVGGFHSSPWLQEDSLNKSEIVADMTSGQKRKAVFEGTFRAPLGELSLDQDNNMPAELQTEHTQDQTHLSAASPSFRPQPSAAPAARPARQSRAARQPHKERSDCGPDALDDGPSEPQLRQTLADLESQWQKVFVQSETTDSALVLLKKDGVDLGDRLRAERREYEESVNKFEDKLLYHWKRVFSLINEEEMKVRVERFVEILSKRVRKRTKTPHESSPSPIRVFEKRKGSYFSGKGSLGEDSLNFKDEPMGVLIERFQEQLSQLQMTTEENKELIGFLSLVLEREEAPMVSVLREVPWLQELKNTTQNMTEYRLADEKRHQEALANAEELEFKIFNLLAQARTEAAKVEGGDFLGHPESILGDKFSLEAIDSAARNVHSVQILSICKNTRDKVKAYLNSLIENQASHMVIKDLAQHVSTWQMTDEADIARELQILLGKETKTLISLHSCLTIIDEAICQRKQIHSFALDYLKYLFDTCEVHLSFLLPALNAVIDPPVLTFAKLSPIKQPLDLIRRLVQTKLKQRYCESILSRVESTEQAVSAFTRPDAQLTESALSDTSRIKKSYDLAEQVGLLNELAGLQESQIRSQMGTSIDSRSEHSPCALPGDSVCLLDVLKKSYHVCYLSGVVAKHKAAVLKTASMWLSLPRSELVPTYPGELSNLALKFDRIWSSTQSKLDTYSAEVQELSKKQAVLKDKSIKLHDELQNVSRMKEAITKQIEKKGSSQRSSMAKYHFSKHSSSISGVPEEKGFKKGVSFKEMPAKHSSSFLGVSQAPQVPKLLKVPVDLSVFKRNPSCQSISASSQRHRSSSGQHSGSNERNGSSVGISRLNSASRTTLHSRGSNKENVAVPGVSQPSKPQSSSGQDFLSRLSDNQITQIKEVHRVLLRNLSSNMGKESGKCGLARRLFKHLDLTAANPALYNLLAQGVFFSIPVKKGPKLKSGYTGVKKVNVNQLWSKFSKSDGSGATAYSDTDLKTNVLSYLEKLGFHQRELKVSADSKSVQLLNLTKMISQPVKRAASPSPVMFHQNKLGVPRSQQQHINEASDAPVEPMNDYTIHIDDVSAVLTKTTKKLILELTGKHKTLSSVLSSSSGKKVSGACELFTWEFISRDLSHSYQLVFPSLEKVLSGVLMCAAADIMIQG